MKELEHPTNSVPKGRRFCTVCGEIKRENHFEGDSTHCDECVRNMLRTRVHAYAVVAALVLTALCAASVFLGVHTVSFCLQTRRADLLAREKLLNASCEAYENAVSGITDINASLLLQRTDEEDETQSAPKLFFTPGVHTWERYCTVYGKAQSDYEAASLIQDSLNAKQVARSAILSAFLEAKKAYEDIYGKLQSISEEHPYEAVEDMPFDLIAQALDTAYRENDSRYYKGYALMFKASAIQYYRTDDPASAVPYFDKALQYLPDERGNICATKAQIAVSQKDWDALRASAEDLLAQYRDYADAYEWLAVAAARQDDARGAQDAVDALRKVVPDTPMIDRLQIRVALIGNDLTRAASLRDEASAKWDTAASELFSMLLADRTLSGADERVLRQYAQFASYAAAVFLLEDKDEEALRYAYEQGFNYSYYLDYLLGTNTITQFMVDVANICAVRSGDAELLDAVSQAGDPSETAQRVLDGKLTLQDAFLGKEAQLI